MIRRLQDASEEDRIHNHCNRQRKRKRYQQAREVVRREAGGDEVFHNDLLCFVEMPNEPRTALHDSARLQLVLTLLTTSAGTWMLAIMLATSSSRFARLA